MCACVCVLQGPVPVSCTHPTNRLSLTCHCAAAWKVPTRLAHCRPACPHTDNTPHLNLTTVCHWWLSTGNLAPTTGAKEACSCWCTSSTRSSLRAASRYACASRQPQMTSGVSMTYLTRPPTAAVAVTQRHTETQTDRATNTRQRMCHAMLLKQQQLSLGARETGSRLLRTEGTPPPPPQNTQQLAQVCQAKALCVCVCQVQRAPLSSLCFLTLSLPS